MKKEKKESPKRTDGDINNEKVNKKIKDFTPRDLSDLIDRLDKKDSSYLKSFITKRSLKKKNKTMVLTRMVAALMVFIFITIGVIYLIGYSYVNYGYGLSVVSSSTQEKRISLSENSGFDRLTSGLRAMPIQGMDNITYVWLPHDELDSHYGGANNGDNYMLYTFYIINVGG